MATKSPVIKAEAILFLLESLHGDLSEGAISQVACDLRCSIADVVYDNRFPIRPENVEARIRIARDFYRPVWAFLIVQVFTDRCRRAEIFWEPAQNEVELALVRSGILNPHVKPVMPDVTIFLL